MLTFNELFTVDKELFPLITGGAIVSAVGLIPRIGLGRAVWIALRSRFALKPVPESLRPAEIKLLKRELADKDFGQGYFVITGVKGVGKSCLLSTVTSKTPGVITVKVPAKEDAKTIAKNTLQRLTRLKFDFIPPFGSAKRVIFWHQLFTLGRSPIVVIEPSEMKLGQKYTDLTSAVRTLVEDYKLRVIVDGSPNSFDESLLRTTRQRVFDIKPMTREMIWQLEQLQELFQFVKEAGLDETVYAVLGGIPADYEELWDDTKIDLRDGHDGRQVIGTHLCAKIYVAIKLVEGFCGKDDKTLVKLMKLGQENEVFLESTLLANKVKRPTPDKLLREVERDGVHVLVPASNAIGIVLRHGLTREPSLDGLEKLIKHKI